MILAQAAQFGPLERLFVGFIDAASTGPLFAIGAVVASMGIGAAHALAPGHGKAITAAYLVGARGRIRDAATLGAVVALMHTTSVLVLGFALFGIARTPTAGEAVGPWMRLASGVLVLVVGVALSVRQARRRTRVPNGHARAHANAHDDDHHSHAVPQDVSPLSRRGLVLVGTSGGLLPSPSAYLVLATGLFTGRTALALALVAAFSVGLAATLTAIGVLVIRGRDALLERSGRARWVARVARVAPVGGAVALTVAGLWLVVAATLALR